MSNIATLNRSGRKPGAKNRIPGEMKEMVEQALHQAGGVEYLARQAEENPAAFLALVGKLLPRNVQADVKSQNLHEIHRIELHPLLGTDADTPFRPVQILTRE
jgi:hypothetical protein